ncbi:A24 family peptidase [Streptomyces sp. C10-9-1]|nr:A24 family peptidase [Streptomyces sp. C10-9-1]MCQ6554551.1 A24 family peptidase [Streptomyces sp. C10-9-1]
MDLLTPTAALAAALWGAAAGTLVPRAAYRLSVRPEEPWRDTCPAGHLLTGPASGWLGPARCAPCASGAPARPRRTDAPAAVDAPGGTGPGGGRGPAGDAGDRGGAGAVYGRSLLAPLVTAAACLLAALATGPRPELAVWLLCIPVGVLLAVVDGAVHRLPDRLTLPLAGAVTVLLGLAALLPGAGGSWSGALLGGAGLGTVYFLLFLLNPRGLGFGDVKLALPLGAALGWYGWAVLFAGAFAGFLLGALYGLGLVALRRADRRTGIPFGPFMLAGAFLGLLAGALTVP